MFCASRVTVIQVADSGKETLLKQGYDLGIRLPCLLSQRDPSVMICVREYDIEAGGEVRLFDRE